MMYDDGSLASEMMLEKIKMDCHDEDEAPPVDEYEEERRRMRREYYYW